ncbi:hypothetical protein QCE63_01485 [Caballeronia sp. LZ065]|uniref:hypothetical protein n=1 Tax=Caballeronia sp. LZ065 TaxID=3038571 RepID=UPI0028619F16|nr:hypothetical protein [Caballeronia sp. LZ065]MDR5778098.1 hypothetical protein [Caballeronia sp. LZ065]
MDGKIEFISLTDAVNAIADRVPEPESWKGIMPMLIENIPKDLKPGSLEDFERWVHANNMRDVASLLMLAYRCSEGASTLDACICNASAWSPRWFDIRPTGRPRQNPALRDEATDILLHMTGYFPRFRDGVKIGKFDTWPASKIEFHEGQYKSHETYQRSREIGFSRPEIVRFLDDNDILHQLGAQAMDYSADTESVVTPTASSKAIDGSPASSEVENHQPRKLRGELAAPITKAWRRLNFIDDYQAVWVEFIKIVMHESSDYRHLKLSYVADEENVKWINSNGDVEFFGKDTMRKRIDSKARGKR